MDQMKSLVDRVFEDMAKQAVMDFIGEESRWSHDSVVDAITKRVEKLLDTDPEIQSLLRQKVVASINDPRKKERS